MDDLRIGSHDFRRNCRYGLFISVPGHRRDRAAKAVHARRRGAGHQAKTSLVGTEAGDVMYGPAAVGISLHRLVEEKRIQTVLAFWGADGLRKFRQQLHPGVDVRG